MLSSTRLCHAVLSASFVGTSMALSVPFRRQLQTPSVNASNPYDFRVIDTTGDGQTIYVANVTLAGQIVEVELDTGSSDFWVNTKNVKLGSGVNDTKLKSSISYGDGSKADGDVFIAPIKFGNFTIPQQAFINAPGSDATNDNDKGLIGLGPTAISQVADSLKNSSFNGNTVLDNVFSTYSNVSNFITFQLARTNLGETDGGIFTVGEVDPNYSAILNQTQIPVLQELLQWVSLMDGVVVNGTTYSGGGILSKIPALDNADTQNKTVALFDTGTALGSVPQYYFDAMYMQIPGIKVISKSDGIYDIPCDTVLNVSMIFNGTEYPINPLDLVQISSVDKGVATCTNTFTPHSLKAEADTITDFVLGDSFLRNVYILYNYGNWTSDNSTQSPYVQLLSTNNQTQALEQYATANQARIQQWSQLKGKFTPSN